jgi:hypothetical protein
MVRPFFYGHWRDAEVRLVAQDWYVGSEFLGLSVTVVMNTF